MPLLLKFHGALDKVTGSCHFLKIATSGNIYAVDCGATQGEDDEDQPAMPRNLPADCYPDKLSGIILTHAHGDHISHLPRWFQAGFRGKILCTRETAKLAEIALVDSMKIEKRRDNWELDDRTFDETIAALQKADYVDPGELTTLEANVTIEAQPTSHLLGCCAFRVNAKSGNKESSVLFTGDIGPIEHSNESKTLISERIRHEKPSQYIVSESTYGREPRGSDSRSGAKRLAKICSMLSKAFRHGDKSVVIIPAFSLQRSLEVMLDVFCALHYHRVETGLSTSSCPLIMVNSPLSWNYAQAYRDFFFGETSGRRFFNDDCLLLQSIREADENEYGVMHDLIPQGKSKLVTRLDESHGKISTEILWGKAEASHGRPTVIICGSGMTHIGPVTDLFYKYLTKEEATFVLCGYVPSGTPGGQLRQLWPLSIPDRASHVIKIPMDPQSGRPKQAVSGDAVKCGFESLSDFYSGHADGASVVRYILGTNAERSAETRGIFLVHGNPVAREGLKELIGETCAKSNVPTPPVHCPTPRGPWFDCETGQFQTKAPSAAATRTASNTKAAPMAPYAPALAGQQPMPTPDMPATVELETCVVLSKTMEIGEITELLKGAFDFGSPEARGNSMRLRFGSADRAHSSVLLQTEQIGDSLVKISVETKIKQAACLAEVADIAFDWRRLLNVLEVPKELYYAGVRWCQNEAEVGRLLAICAPNVYGTKQRRQPVLILQADTLDDDALQAVERLLTPCVVVAIVHEQFVPMVNDALGLSDENKLCRTNPIYLPVKFIAGAKSVFSESTGVNLAKISEIVTADTYIVYAREPQISGRGQPSPLTTIPDETQVTRSAKIPEQKKQGGKTDRANLPYALFTELAAGQKLSGKVEHVRFRKNTTVPIFALVRLMQHGVAGMLHSSQMLPVFSAKEGDEIEVYVRKVDAEKRDIYLSQQNVRLPAHDFLRLLDAERANTSAGIASLLGAKVSIEAAIREANTSLMLQSKAHGEILPESQLDRATCIDTYNRLVKEFVLVDTPLIPSPEPIKGVTYGDVANTLGYSLQDIVNAAGHMIGDPGTYELGMAVLPGGFTPADDSPFPADRKEAFIRECLSRAEKGWASPSQDEASKIQPDCHSIAELARLMGIPQPTLLARLEEKGIKPEVRVVVTPDDIRKLIG